MKTLIKLILFVAVLAAAWFFVSPWWTMKQIVDAAEAGDAETLEELVDFAALREGMHADLRASRQDGDTDLLDRIGDAVVTTAGGAAIDTFANPNGFAVLLDASTIVPGEDYSWDVERISFDRFRAVSTTGEGDPGPVLLFERDGLGWQMVGVRV